MAAMRRTIAIALAVGLLFAGGCQRQDRQDRQQPAVVSTPSAPAAAVATPTPASADTGAVDQLLDQVDQQLSGDAQPADDED